MESPGQALVVRIFLAQPRQVPHLSPGRLTVSRMEENFKLKSDEDRLILFGKPVSRPESSQGFAESVHFPFLKITFGHKEFCRSRVGIGPLEGSAPLFDQNGERLPPAKVFPPDEKVSLRAGKRDPVSAT